MDELKYSMRTCGAPCVMTAGILTVAKMQGLYAINLDSRAVDSMAGEVLLVLVPEQATSG